MNFLSSTQHHDQSLEKRSILHSLLSEVSDHASTSSRGGEYANGRQRRDKTSRKDFSYAMLAMFTTLAVLAVAMRL